MKKQTRRVNSYEINNKKPVWKQITVLAFPIVLANILQSGYQLTDAFWVGKLGQTAVASVSIVGPIMYLIISLGTGFAMAGTIFIAQYYGAQDQKNIDHAAGQTILSIAGVSVLLSGAGILLSPFIVGWMKVAPDVAVGALSYMKIAFVGLIFNFLFFMFQSLLRGIGEANLPLKIVFLTVILNFALDPLLIFGYGVIPKMGVTGAALATLLTQMIAAVIGMTLLLKGEYGIHIKRENLIPDWKFIKRSFLLGLPSSIEQSSRALSMTVMISLVAIFGTSTVAGYGAAGNIFFLAIIPALGLSMAVSTLAGHAFGAGDVSKALMIAWMGALIGVGSLSTLAIFVYFFSPQILSLLLPGQAPALVAGVEYLKITSPYWGLIGAQMVLTGVFRAGGKMKQPMILSILSEWGFTLPIAFYLSRHTTYGQFGIWWAQVISTFAIFVIAFVWFKKTDWSKSSLVTRVTRYSKIEKSVTEEALIEEGVRQS